MTVKRGTLHFCDHFNRAQSITTTPGVNGWTIKDTSSSGTPTYLCQSEPGGALKLTLAATSEEEIVTLYHNDVLTIDPNKLRYVRWVAKVASIDSVTTLVAGVASAQNDTEDSVARHAWFRMEGSASTSALVVESDDGTTDLDDKSTGLSLSSTYLDLLIDFQNGLSDVRFAVNGNRVAAGTTFDLDQIGTTNYLQPFVQLHKASGTGTPSVSLAMFEYEAVYAYGS